METTATVTKQQFNVMNPNSFRPPVKEGTFIGQIAFSDPDPDTRWTPKEQEDGTTTYSAKIVVTYTGEDDEEVKGRKVYGFVSTKLDKNGFSQAIKLVWALGEGERLIEEVVSDDDPHLAITRLLDDAMFGEPLVKAQNIWVAEEKNVDGSGYTKLAERVRNFPLKEDGSGDHDFVVTSPATGQKVAAKAKLNGIFELGNNR